MRRSDFFSSGPMGVPFTPGQKVMCVNADGCGLSKRAVYVVSDAKDCQLCRGGIRLTSGPRPTDVPCGWWDAKRFRPLDPPNDELTQRIRKAKPTPTKVKEPELV